MSDQPSSSQVQAPGSLTGMFGGEGATGGLRAGLLLLVVLGVTGTALALAYERHWHGPWQLAPWITLGLIIVATVGLGIRAQPALVWLARTVAVLAIVGGVLGVWQHIDANHDAGTLAQEDSGDGHGHSHSHDSEPTADGPSMGDVLSGAVGHAPVPAALSIAPVGLALGLATIGLGGRRRTPAE